MHVCRSVSYIVAMSTVHPLSDYRTTWGDRLRRIRLAHGLDQEEMGMAIDVKKATVGKYELQPTTPRAHRLIENSVELHFGTRAAEYLRGVPSTDYELEGSRVLVFPGVAA